MAEWMHLPSDMKILAHIVVAGKPQGAFAWEPPPFLFQGRGGGSFFVSWKILVICARIGEVCHWILGRGMSHE